MYHLNLTGRRSYDQLYAGCILVACCCGWRTCPFCLFILQPRYIDTKATSHWGWTWGENYQRMKWDFVTSFLFTNHLISPTSDNPFTPYFNLSSINHDKNSGILWFKFRKYSKSPEITNLSNLSLRSSKFCIQVTALSSSLKYLETQSPIILCTSDTLPNNLSMQA